MQLTIGNEYHAFLLREEKMIKELNSTARLFHHTKSGAQLLHLENDDDNKVFSVSFRTPPTDSTGLPHILEHSVLCGSRKFPSKEPFVELAKGSLNTFLNAMTYPDKTVYPIASRNDKDFKNLMDVYLDAVFYPNIYDQHETLMQEGWHYELENKDEPLRYKGVVYNEMKGAFSSPEQVLFSKIQESLYPDTPYGFESGGDPQAIPNLTQEQFLDFHKKYYHPANSYIFLYGDGDMMEHLQFINEGYLNNFDDMSVDSEINIQQAFKECRMIDVEYPISTGDKTADKTYLSLNFSIGRSTDPFLYLAFTILEYLLLDNPAAPLKKALLEAGIGKDVFGVYENSMLQPIFSIVAKDTNDDQRDSFIKIIRETLTQLVSKGIDKRLIEASINYREFKIREADFGGKPKGLIYGIKAMDSWLYGKDPTLHLSFESSLSKIKEALSSSLFEDLIQNYLLNNTHSTLLVVKPKPGLAEEREKKTHERLQELKSQMTEKDIERIINNTKALKQRQAAPDTPEALASIPMVSLEDIEAKAEQLPLTEKTESGVKVLHHAMFTNRIAYLSLLFDTNSVPQDLLPYAGLLTSVLGEISTKSHHYEELSNEINIHTGGIDFSTQAFALNGQVDGFVPKLTINAKALVTKLPELMSLLKELITETQFDDSRRLMEVIQEARSRLEMQIYQQGHLLSINRLSAYFSPAGKYNELVTGISFYRFLADLEKDFEQKKDEIIENLKKVTGYIMNKKGLLISATVSDDDYTSLQQQLAPFTESLADNPQSAQNYDFGLTALNEGLMTPGEVQYVAKGYNFIKMGYEYKGSLQVLRTIASLDYLWNRVRVQGGAYGAFAHFTRSGSMLFASYRDPNLKETLMVYDQLAEYLETFNTDNREMTKYIIGTVSRLDTPLTPPMMGQKATANYLSGVSQDDIQRERDEIINAKTEDIKDLAPMVKDVLKNEYYCVLGSESKIKENKDLFKKLVQVFE